MMPLSMTSQVQAMFGYLATLNIKDTFLLFPLMEKCIQLVLLEFMQSHFMKLLLELGFLKMDKKLQSL